MCISFLILYIFSSLVFSQTDAIVPDSENLEMAGPDHISLLIHEDLINEFFKNMGQFVGGGKNYNWKLKNPRVRITKEEALFNGEIQVSAGILSTTYDVIGKIDVFYDKDENVVILKIVSADVIIDIAGYDIGKINIGKHFSKPLTLDGPQAVSEYIEFPLPSGDIRRINVTVESYSVNLIEGAIKVSTSLGFKAVVIPAVKEETTQVN